MDCLSLADHSWFNYTPLIVYTNDPGMDTWWVKELLLILKLNCFYYTHS